MSHTHRTRHERWVTMQTHRIGAGPPAALTKIKTAPAATGPAEWLNAPEQQVLWARRQAFEDHADALQRVPWTAPARLAHGRSDGAAGRGAQHKAGQHTADTDGCVQPPPAFFPGAHAYMPNPNGLAPQWQMLHEVQLLLSHGVSPTHVAAMMAQGHFSPALAAADAAAAGGGAADSCARIMADLRAGPAAPASGGAGAGAQADIGDGADRKPLLGSMKRGRAVTAMEDCRREAAEADAAGLPVPLRDGAAASEAGGGQGGDEEWRELHVPTAVSSDAAAAGTLRGLRSEPRCELRHVSRP